MHYASAARTWIVLTAVLGIVQAGAIIAQSITISSVISPVIADGAGLSDVVGGLWMLAEIGVVRVLLTLIRQTQAHKAAQAATRQLRRRLLSHASRLGPRWMAAKGADTATLATRGLDDLEPYFVDYLPQLMLAVTVTPLALVVMVVLDWISALVAVITIPLIPLFMILIGRLTQTYSDRRLAAMQRQGRQLLDLIAGLPTLKALGREKGPEREITSIGRVYVSTTMATLRIAFLSGAVLEFIATLSVALVAVEVGMRLVYGMIDLHTGLILIMLAPEVYQPIREVGKQFHASANGVAAANATFDVLDTEVSVPEGSRPLPAGDAEIVFDDVWVAARGAWAPAGLSGRVPRGSLCVLAGESGAGKTTALMVALARLAPDRGAVRVGGIDVRDIDRTAWYSQVTWLPQSPVIFPGSLRDNVAPEGADGSGLAAAAHASGFDEVVAERAEGWESPVGAGGVGLSVGQRQRLALTRVILSDEPIVVLDEPTAHLDATLETHVLAAIDELLAQGRTVIAIAHRPALIARADVVLHVHSQPFTAEESRHHADQGVEPASASDIELPTLLGEFATEVRY
ncbi:thiol reductant ABC exporter subunit CydD [Nanchangia anserum]|nr:thiol reductant ABC exporter subunit CydD [Nanchangia anserum]